MTLTRSSSGASFGSASIRFSTPRLSSRALMWIRARGLLLAPVPRPRGARPRPGRPGREGQGGDREPAPHPRAPPEAEQWLGIATRAVELLLARVGAAERITPEEAMVPARGLASDLSYYGDRARILCAQAER